MNDSVNDSNQNNGISDEQRSKDECFEKLAELATAMIERHGKDFTMGSLVIAARFIAEGKPLQGIGQSH